MLACHVEISPGFQSVSFSTHFYQHHGSVTCSAKSFYQDAIDTIKTRTSAKAVDVAKEFTYLITDCEDDSVAHHRPQDFVSCMIDPSHLIRT